MTADQTMKAGNAPALSVVMSVYNAEAYLADAIDSVLAQTYRDFEFIVIDDGSTDGSTQIMRDYADRDPRIRLLEQDNTGLTVALCRGVEAARGRYVARMDADDVSMPERFEKQVATLDARPDFVAVTCHVEHFYDDGSISHVATRKSDPRLLPLYNCFSNRIGGHGQVMFRRSAYDAAGGYDPSFRYAQDYDLWTRLTEHGSFGSVDDMLYRFRTGHDSISSKSKSGQEASSLRTCRREYEKLTGTPIDKKTARATRNFWWTKPPEDTSLAKTLASSLAMAHAVEIFFARNPALRKHEFSVRREIAANWRWRVKSTRPWDYPRKAVLAANVLHWGTTALIARRRHGDAVD